MPVPKLLLGFTTGTCAQASVTAACAMLKEQRYVQEVNVVLPNGEALTLEINNQKFTANEASCSILKDAGDDPDVTNGACISAQVRFTNKKGISITGGQGVGMVTKAGLAVPIGKPAINPIPRKMIVAAVENAFGKEASVEVIISVEQGKEIAKRTMNGALGIVGGISILGTSGRVKPMSEEALKDSLHLKLSQLQAEGKAIAIFTLGNYGSNFLIKAYTAISEDDCVMTSNYVGFMLEQAVRYSFRTILLVGHIGKLIKLAGGIFHTHSKVADARNEILASHYLHHTGDVAMFKKLFVCNTTEEAVENITNNSFYSYLAETIKKRSQQHVKNELNVEVLLFSQQKGELGRTENFECELNKVAE